MFKVRPQAVKYSIDAAAPNKDLDDDIVQHDFQEKSQNKNKGLAKMSNFPGKTPSGASGNIPQSQNYRVLIHKKVKIIFDQGCVGY